MVRADDRRRNADRAGQKTSPLARRLVVFEISVERRTLFERSCDGKRACGPRRPNFVVKS
jgi:hypothetical protein